MYNIWKLYKCDYLREHYLQKEMFINKCVNAVRSTLT